MQRRKDPRNVTLDYQERRRKEALQLQRTARESLLAQSRSQQIADKSNINNGTAPPRNTTDLMIPEWMIEIPSNLSSDWFVLPRPEGQRCEVTTTLIHSGSDNGTSTAITAQLRNGAFLTNLQRTHASNNDTILPSNCILDCIYQKSNNIYYVLDVLNWRGAQMTDCTTEFRLYWIQSKFNEDVEGVPRVDDRRGSPETGRQPQHHRHRHRHPRDKNNNSTAVKFLPLPVYEANPDGLHAAYNVTHFVQDGLYFIHRHTHYFPGQTPLALYWKDARCSRFFLDTDANGIVPQDQHLVLRYQQRTRGVATSDEPPIVLATMPEEFVNTVDRKGALRDGRLLRFRLGPGGVDFDHHALGRISADLHYAGVANQRRGRADSLSKIVFQMMARRQPIRFSDLVSHATTTSTITMEMSTPEQKRQDTHGGNVDEEGGGMNVLDISTSSYSIGVERE